jgi:flavin reductase (DIM6/NTAB) family NADH-FMN oxidoreductase RutF
MHINPATIERKNLYKIIIGCIVPRPIGWVSTQDTAGLNNLAPFSFFNGVSSNPPALMVSIAARPTRPDGYKDTLRNILELREFVVNIVSEATAAAMDKTAQEYPPEVDEFQVAGLTPAPSVVVRPPRVAEAPASFECVLHDTMQLGEGPGSNTLVVGIINHVFVRDDIINERGHIDIRRLQPVGRLAGKSYCTIRDIFELTGD